MGQGHQPQPLAAAGGARGKWYFVITVASFGVLSAVPFFHAATKLHKRALRKIGAVYAAISVLGFALIGVAPVDADGSPTGTLSNVGAVLLLGVMVVAIVQQIGLREDVYGQPRASLPTTDNRSAIDRVEEVRARRREARSLAHKDPFMARELRIGRPDLPRDYDDGGLVDLNSAPAPAIAECCQITPSAAQQLVTVREQIGGFGSVEEAIVYADVSSASGLRERGIVITP